MSAWDDVIGAARVDELEDALEEIRSDISSLYAIRGEDNLIAEHCNRILALIENVYV